jgi:hypothetical protein
LPVIVVGGSNKSCGKTSLICAIIAAFPELMWTAVKISSHPYGAVEPVWEESMPGPGTDTARYLAAGAHRALLVSSSETTLRGREMQAAVSEDRNVIYESNRISEEIQPDLRLAVVSGAETGFKLSFVPFLEAADAVIAPAGGDLAFPVSFGKPVFRQSPPGEISLEFMEWLRERLAGG